MPIGNGVIDFMHINILVFSKYFTYNYSILNEFMQEKRRNFYRGEQFICSNMPLPTTEDRPSRTDMYLHTKWTKTRENIMPIGSGETTEMFEYRSVFVILFLIYTRMH